MRPQSAKAKGRRFQQWTAAQVVALFRDDLEPGDVRSLSMGAAGDDLLLSPLAMRLIRFDWECKNVENFQVWAALRQAYARDDPVPVGGDPVLWRHPIVAVKRNRTDPLVIVPFGWAYDTSRWAPAAEPMEEDDVVLLDDAAESPEPGPEPEPEPDPVVPHRAAVTDIGPSHVVGLHLSVAGLPGVEVHSETHLLWNGHRVYCHGGKTMKFWPTVDAHRGDAECILFNRGEPDGVMHLAMHWKVFTPLFERDVARRRSAAAQG